MMMNEEAMTNEEAIKLLSQVRDAILASNSWLPSTDNPIKECFGMAIEALKAQDAAGDTISRQAAIDALRTCYDTETVTMDDGDEYINYGDAIGEIEQLPSAQPEIVRCGSCKYAEIADARDNQDGYTCQFHRGSIWFSGSYCSWAERRTDG